MSKKYRLTIISILILLSVLGKALMIYELYNNDDLWLNVIQGVYYISLENLIYITDAALATMLFAICMGNQKRIPIIVGAAIISTSLFMLYLVALNYTWQWLEWHGYWGWHEPIYMPLDFLRWGLRYYVNTGHPRYHIAAAAYFVAVLAFRHRTEIRRLCVKVVMRLTGGEKS